MRMSKLPKLQRPPLQIRTQKTVVTTRLVLDSALTKEVRMHL